MGNMRRSVFLFTFMLILQLLALSTTQESKIQRHQPRPGKDEVVFGIFKDGNRPSCKQNEKHGHHGQTFCEQARNYPKKHFDNWIKKSKLSIKKFFVDRRTLNQTAVVTRRVDEDGRDYMCPSYRMSIFPQMAQTTKGQWRYILNHGTLSQVVEVDVCYETGPCSMWRHVHLVNVETQCKQIYNSKNLFSFDESKNLVLESFMFQSGCECTYAMPTKHTFNPSWP